MAIDDQHKVDGAPEVAPHRVGNPRTGASVTREVALVTTVSDTAAVIQLTGEIDLGTVEDAAWRLEQAAAAFPPRWLVVLDLTEISYLSVAGLRAMRAFIATATERGLRIRVAVAPGSAVQRLLDISPLGPRLSTYGTAEKALHDGT